MSVVDDIREQVTDAAAGRGLKDHRAFAFWFLEEIEDFSQEEAHDLVVDGPWDDGRDAIFFDEDTGSLKIYQFKYSQDVKYIEAAFNDIQRALKREKPNLERADEVTFFVVSLAEPNEDLRTLATKVQTRIKRWLTTNGIEIDSRVEFYDLNSFAQLFQKLYGIDIDIEFREQPIEVDDGLLGLANACRFKDRAAEEELFAFNIRKYLGRRKGSVNAQIRESLENEKARPAFWMLNNGIVCLCTAYEAVDESTYHFKNFTIVNGAQTVTTVSGFLQDNDAIEDPVWVVAKVICVDEDDIDRARLLTKTANTQTPATNKDLRAVDLLHRRLAEWFGKYFDTRYLYRRGDKAKRGEDSVTMKDIAQSLIAYSEELPHVAFARVGTIFSQGALYDAVFPAADIADLHESGATDEIREFLLQRLVPVAIAARIRTYLAKNVASEDKRWRSLVYHLCWLYGLLLRTDKHENQLKIHENADGLVDETIAYLYEGLKDFCINGDLTVPRDLKSVAVQERLIERAFIDQGPATRARKRIAEILA